MEKETLCLMTGKPSSKQGADQEDQTQVVIFLLPVMKNKYRSAPHPSRGAHEERRRL